MNPHQAQASSSKPVRPAGALTPELLGRFKPAKVFTEEALERGAPGSSPAQGASSTSLKPQIISIAFDDTGDRCLTSGEDEGFTLWDAKKGK
jgi:COMPASS component SWD2